MKKTKAHINARVNDGYTLADFRGGDREEGSGVARNGDGQISTAGNLVRHKIRGLSQPE